MTAVTKRSASPINLCIGSSSVRVYSSQIVSQPALVFIDFSLELAQ